MALFQVFRIYIGRERNKFQGIHVLNTRRFAGVKQLKMIIGNTNDLTNIFICV